MDRNNQKIYKNRSHNYKYKDKNSQNNTWNFAPTAVSSDGTCNIYVTGK